VLPYLLIKKKFSLALVLWNHLVQQHLFLVVDSEPLLSVGGRCLIFDCFCVKKALTACLRGLKALLTLKKPVCRKK
jgi:hypothetical protein